MFTGAVIHPRSKEAVRQFNFRAKTREKKAYKAYKSKKKELDYY
jgi:hypothetical protein